MGYSSFPRWMMKLPKRRDGYLNQQVILFRLQYETHSLQINPELPWRYVITPTPKLPEGRYALRLVVIPSWYFPSPLPFFQSILPSPSSHISSVAVPHLLRRHIHTCCTTSPSPLLHVAVFAAGLVCHPYYTASPPHLHFHSPASLLRFSSHYLPSSHVLCRGFLSTSLDRIFSSLCVVLYYTDCSALLHTTFLTLCSDLLTTLLFYLLARIFSLSVLFLLRSNLPRFSPLDFTPLCSNLTILLRSVCSNMLPPYLIWSSLIDPLMLWSSCSDLLGSARSDLLCFSFLWTF